MTTTATETAAILAPRNYSIRQSSAARMTIKHTTRRAGGGKIVLGAGFAMFGHGESGWFERHFASREAAQRFAEQRGWTWEFLVP